MKLSARLLIFLIICTLSTQGVKAEDANDLEINQDSAVSIELTKFDVNDTTLELAWKIVNNTDHEIWMCQSLQQTQGSSVFERFLDKDDKTLVVSRRFFVVVRESLLYKYPPIRSRYVRLNPGQVQNESVSYALPIQPNPFSATESGNAEFAERISLEIGYFDENLPDMILKIVELAEHFSCNLEVGLPNPNDPKDSEICGRFFGGRNIAQAFKHALGWSDSVTSGNDDIWVPYFGPYMGEKIVRLTIDNISIPYKSENPPLENQDVNEPADLPDVEQSAVSMELTHFEITDANLELAWNIKNNTDHDVWVCDSIATSRTFQFEIFLAEDFQTLVIRRRLDVPTYVMWARGAPSGKYICLRPGEERPESLSLNLPVQYSLLYGLDKWTSVEKCARRLELEIGFYDQDLPGLVYSILQLADALVSGIDQETDYEADSTVKNEYFRGLLVRARLGSLSSFEKVNKDPYSEGEVLINYTYQALKGEKILRIVVDGMSIPYEGYVQLANE